VLDASGKPVPGAFIVIVASTVPMPEIALVSDGEGQLALSLPSGRFTLRAHDPDGATGTAEADGAPNTDEIVIRIGS